MTKIVDIEREIRHELREEVRDFASVHPNMTPRQAEERVALIERGPRPRHGSGQEGGPTLDESIAVLAKLDAAHGSATVHSSKTQDQILQANAALQRTNELLEHANLELRDENASLRATTGELRSRLERAHFRGDMLHWLYMREHLHGEDVFQLRASLAGPELTPEEFAYLMELRRVRDSEAARTGVQWPLRFPGCLPYFLRLSRWVRQGHFRPWGPSGHAPADDEDET